MTLAWPHGLPCIEGSANVTFMGGKNRLFSGLWFRGFPTTVHYIFLLWEKLLGPHYLCLATCEATHIIQVK